MQTLFKLSGMAVLLAACTLFGYMKAYRLKKRANRLAAISFSLSRLCEMIRTDSGEMSDLVRESFPQGDIRFYNGRVMIDKVHLTDEDTALIRQFFQKAGMGDITAEAERMTGLRQMIDKQGQKAETDYRESARLYNSAGFLAGLAVCIFFI